MNPERLRGEYGKLMYVLQDSQVPEVEDMLHFSLKMDIHTVYELLEVSVHICICWCGCGGDGVCVCVCVCVLTCRVCDDVERRSRGAKAAARPSRRGNE